VVDLDAADEGADDLAPVVPAEPLQQPGADAARELLQAPDHARQAALGLARRGKGVARRLEPGEALLEPSQARLEPVGVDDLLLRLAADLVAVRAGATVVAVVGGPGRRPPTRPRAILPWKA
jgi:hypothetical protein